MSSKERIDLGGYLFGAAIALAAIGSALVWIWGSVK